MNTRILLTATLAFGLGSAAAQRVANAEYYWDSDPGAGNALPLSAADGAFDAALETLLMQTTTLPGLGAHTLGIRVKDQQNNWGTTFTTVVEIGPSATMLPNIEVTEAEYYWDTDPGEGSGTPMLAFDGDFSSALEAIAMETALLPAIGAHILHVRSKDVNGAWSLPFRTVVEVTGGTATFPEIQVAAAEYYLNEDPGAGNGTPMLAADGDFSAALEAVRGGDIPVPVAAGVNVLWLRARDMNAAWGPSFGIVVNIDTTITGTVGVAEEVVRTMRLWPNPTRAEEGFTIALDRAVGEVRVRVLDAAGRVVVDRRMQRERRIPISMPDAAPGVYHVGVFLDGVPRWERLIVQ